MANHGVSQSFSPVLVRAGIPAALLCLLVGFSAAHEEPPKTQKELAQHTRDCAKTSRNGIRTARIYKSSGTAAPALLLEMQYSAEGTVASMTQYNSSGPVVERSSFTYDGALGLLTDEDLDAEGRTTGKVTYSYDKAGLVSGAYVMETETGAVKKYRFEYSRDEKAKAALFVKYALDSGKETVEYRLRYVYDGPPDSANNTGIIKTAPDGAQLMRVANTFDSEGRRTVKAVYGAKDELLYKFVYKYNRSGDISVIEKLDPAGRRQWLDKYSYNSGTDVERIATYSPENQKVAVMEYRYEYR
ncbi:MAG TPA: hypothetical protein PKI19_03880 [Elusimicrobiales bacterium]|nr:hypothetical protein [Elusimicrobiales bacterium]